jgi:hypothetical protein
MTPAELNYTVTKKEFLAVIYAINKFRHYIIGYSTLVHTDHSVIKYLMKNLSQMLESPDGYYYYKNLILQL